MTEETSEPRGRGAALTDLARILAGGLWFPLLFFFGFLLCYALPFHNPTPHDVRVAVSGPQAAREIRAGFGKASPGAFDIVTAGSPAEARRKVLDRDTEAAFAADAARPTLYLAKADGALLEQAVTTAFRTVVERGGGQLTTVELVPTASGDTSGTGLFYLTMSLNISAYIAVMMLIRAHLTRRGKLLTLVCLSAFMSVVAYLIGRGLDIVPGEPLGILYLFLLSQAVAWVTYGLVPFVKQFLPGVAITLFVLLSIPSSGGAIPYQMVPAFFRALHPVFPLGNVIEALHGIFSFDGKGVLRPTLVLCAWLLLGLLLVALGAVLARRKEHEHAGAAVPEAPVEDPALEAPVPHAVTPGAHDPFGERAVVLGGEVFHDDGRPAPGVFITVLGHDGHQLLHTVTDEDGRWGAAGLPEDWVTVLALAKGHRPAASRVLPREGHVTRQDFVLATPSAHAVPSA
ncbi:carboxypeptidase regulatory-like domain-containing protein [Streptomyces sp. NPDC004959]|uniref:carboxypeptidase regulatory-like domain-containing protein n=1 Tax=unclassified Streptomyces TaxID=2593676 RepID=UPI0033BAC2DB